MASTNYEATVQTGVHPLIQQSIKAFGLVPAQSAGSANEAAFPGSDPAKPEPSDLYKVVAGFVASSCTRLRYEPAVTETSPGEFHVTYTHGADIARLHQLGLALNTLDGVVSVTQVVKGRSGFTSTTLVQSKHY